MTNLKYAASWTARTMLEYGCRVACMLWESSRTLTSSWGAAMRAGDELKPLLKMLTEQFH